MKLSIFDGGLNTRLDPRLVNPTESVANTNVDMSAGIIKSATLPAETALELHDNAFFFASEGKWVSFEEPTQFLEFQGVLYYVKDGIAYKYKNDQENLLGVVKPDTAPSVSTLYSGIKWAGLVSNNKDVADLVIVAIGNKGDKDWSHTVTMTSYDSGETWAIREHLDYDTQWLSLAYDPLNDEFIATGEVKDDFRKAILFSYNGEDWRLAKMSEGVPTVKKIWNFYPRKYPSGTLDSIRYWALVQHTNGTIYAAYLTRTIFGTSSDDSIQVNYGSALLAHTHTFAVQETDASTAVVVAVNNSNTLQRTTNLIMAGWTSYSYIGPVGSVLRGWQTIAHSYSTAAGAERFFIASEAGICVSTTALDGTTWSVYNSFVTDFPFTNVTAMNNRELVMSQLYVGLADGVICRIPGITSGVENNYEYERSCLQTEIKAIGQTVANKEFAIDRLGYIAIRDSSQEWQLAGRQLGNVKFAKFNYYTGMAVVTEDNKIHMSSDGVIWSTQNSPNSEVITDIVWQKYSASDWSLFVATEAKKVYRLVDNAVVSVAAAHISASISMTRAEGYKIYTYSKDMSTVDSKITVVDANAMTITALALRAAGTSKCISHIGEFRALTDTCFLLTSDFYTYDIYTTAGDTSTSFTSSTNPVVTEYAGGNEFLIIANNQSLSYTIHAAGTTPVAENFYFGTKPGKFLRTADYTFLHFEHSDYYWAPYGSSPYYQWKVMAATPYKEARRNYSLGATISGPSGNKGIYLSTLPCPFFIARSYNSAFGSVVTYYKAGQAAYAYSWAYTYLNDDDGTESAPSPLSIEVSETDLGNSAVTLTLEESSDPQVSTILLYRIGGTATNYTLIAELPNDTQQYIDYLGEYLDRVLTTDDNYAPPADITFISYFNNRFFASVGNKLYFSDDTANPNYWPPENYIELVATCTGLKATATGLYIFFEDSVYLLVGQSILNFSLNPIEVNFGTTYSDTIVAQGNSVLFVGRNEVYQIIGTQVNSISKVQLSTSALVAVNAVWYRDCYYIQMEETILALDLRYSPRWQHYSFGTHRLITGDAKLLGKVDTLSTVELFKGDELAEFHYMTPRLTEGAVTVAKSYNVLYIGSQGDITVSVYIDGDKVIDDKILAEKYIQELQVPQASRRGYDIQLEFKGIGEIYEVEYVPKGREK